MITPREIVKAARRPWGDAWVMLTPGHRRALICEQIVAVLAGQNDDTLARNPALARISKLADAALAAYHDPTATGAGD
jgi:hypothetical protein